MYSNVKSRWYFLIYEKMLIRVDLNRDAFNTTQPEMQILHSVYKSFQPDYCYNLHDQNYFLEQKFYFNLTKTVFLSPTYNEEGI